MRGKKTSMLPLIMTYNIHDVFKIPKIQPTTANLLILWSNFQPNFNMNLYME
jgi:hypothetical protein